MRKIYATFSGDKYHDTTREIVRRAPLFGVDEVWVYDDHWLRTKRAEYCAQNKWLFEHRCHTGPPREPSFHDEPGPRGVNWFAFKPFVVLDALERAVPGDLVLFTDADTYPIAPLQVLYDICQRDGLMLFSAVGNWHSRWCKRECFAVMGQDEPRWRDVQHAVARFMLFRRPERMSASRPVQMLWEWFTYTLNPLATTFTQTGRLGLPEYPEFYEHRCEQAILTNLAHKYGFRLYREACAYGNSVKDDLDLYPQLFEQIGGHSYGPVRGQGSMFRNIED
jgi:hypothetical protein